MKNIVTYSAAAVLGLGLLAANTADAQQFSKRKKYTSVGFSLNAMNYFGDLVSQTDFTSFRFGATRPNVGVNIMRRMTPRLSGRFGLTVGQITGNDALAASQTDPDAKYRYNRNMNFSNIIMEASAVAVFDLVENRNKYIKRPDFVPYVFAGVAGFYHNPQGKVGDAQKDISGSETNVSLKPLKTEGVDYSLAQFSIPFGGGVRYRVSRSLDASLEIGWRKTFTDYLDDVSGTFVDPAKLTTDNAKYFGGGVTRSTTGDFAGFTTPGQARRGKDGNDWYIVTGVSLNYILAPKIKNPKFR